MPCSCNDLWSISGEAPWWRRSFVPFFEGSLSQTILRSSRPRLQAARLRLQPSPLKHVTWISIGCTSPTAMSWSLIETTPETRCVALEPRWLRGFCRAGGIWVTIGCQEMLVLQAKNVIQPQFFRCWIKVTEVSMSTDLSGTRILELVKLGGIVNHDLP